MKVPFDTYDEKRAEKLRVDYTTPRGSSWQERSAAHFRRLRRVRVLCAWAVPARGGVARRPQPAVAGGARGELKLCPCGNCRLCYTSARQRRRPP